MTAKETKVKVSQEGVGGAASAVDDSQFNLDGILSELGSFGKYQLLLLFLLAFRDSFLNMCNFNYVFTAAEVPFRCVVPECEDTDSRFNASWQSFAIGNHSQICHRMIPLGDHERHLNSVSNKSSTSLNFSSSKCAPDSFSTDIIYPCEKVVYENYNSIVAEFDLGCQPFKRTLIGTIHNLGLVFSYVVSGIISDRYGRKVIIVATPLVVGTVGLLKSFSVNYWMLIVLEFLETALGYGNASMVLSLESVSHKRRVVFSCISDILCSFGSAFFGLIAWRVQYWRHLIRAIYAPLLVVVFYIFLVDEGVRWLLAHKKNLEAVRVLNKVAKINNITLSNKAKEMLSKISKENEAIEAGEAAESGGSAGSWASVWEVLRSRRIVSRMALMAACFVCGMFVYNGTIVNATSISGDKYVNLSALFLVSIPTRVVTALTLTRFGRRAPICLAYCFCAVFFITSAFVPKNVWWASVVLYVVGKMCSSYGVFSLNVVALEVFPTTSRNTLTNIANTFGRLGSVLAPQAPLLEKYMSGLTSILFGVVALGPAALALLLPDTTHVSLPDDIAAAERLDSANRKNNDGNFKANDQKWIDHTTLGGLSKPTLDDTGHTDDAEIMRDAKPKHYDRGNS